MAKTPEKITIMVVDDMEPIRNVLYKMLSQWGYSVVTYSEAMSAIQAALMTPPDLFLLDINMPGMDGFELCRSIKKDDKLKDIPVIFISVLDEAMDKVKAFSSGAVDYITKPFQMEEVFARVTTHIKLQQYRNKFETLAKEIDSKDNQLSRMDIQQSMESIVDIKKIDLKEKEHLLENGKENIYHLRGDLEDIKSMVRLCNNLGTDEDATQVQLIQTLCSSIDYRKLMEHFDKLLIDLEETINNLGMVQ